MTLENLYSWREGPLFYALKCRPRVLSGGAGCRLERRILLHACAGAKGSQGKRETETAKKSRPYCVKKATLRLHFSTVHVFLPVSSFSYLACLRATDEHLHARAYFCSTFGLPGAMLRARDAPHFFWREIQTHISPFDAHVSLYGKRMRAGERDDDVQSTGRNSVEELIFGWS